MVAVPVHQVVSVPPVLPAQLLQDPLHLVLGEVGVAQVQRLLVPELLPQLPRLARTDVEDSGEWEGVTTICVLSSIHLQTTVIHTHTQGGGVLVGPEHVVDVEDDGLPGHVQDAGLLHLLSLVRGAERYLAASIHHVIALEMSNIQCLYHKNLLISIASHSS